MNAFVRAGLCLALLSLGVAAQAGLESMSRIDRPPLRRPLESLPHELKRLDRESTRRSTPRFVLESQATELVSRGYENPKLPRRSAQPVGELLAAR